MSGSTMRAMAIHCCAAENAAPCERDGAPATEIEVDNCVHGVRPRSRALALHTKLEANAGAASPCHPATSTVAGTTEHAAPAQKRCGHNTGKSQTSRRFHAESLLVIASSAWGAMPRR